MATWTITGNMQGPNGTDGADGATGPEGPTAVSTDSPNSLTLGTDGKIFYRDRWTSGPPDEDAKITTSADVGIGTDSPSEALDVVGNGKFSGLTNTTVQIDASSIPRLSFTDGATTRALFMAYTTGLVVRSGAGSLYLQTVGGHVSLNPDIGYKTLAANGDFEVTNGTSKAKAHTSDFCDLSISSIQNIGGSNGTINYINWNGTELHKDAEFTHSTSTNTSRIEVATTGRFHIKVVINADNTGSNRTTLRSFYRVNGSGWGGTTSYRGSQSAYSRGQYFGNQYALPLDVEVELDADDYIEIGVEVEDADGAYTVNTVPDECVFIMRRIG